MKIRDLLPTMVPYPDGTVLPPAIISEMPQLSRPTTFDLDKDEENKTLVADLLSEKKKKVFLDTNRIKLFMTPLSFDDTGYIASYNKTTKLADYVVKFKVVTDQPWLGVCVTSILMWRRRGSMAGITLKVFNDCLLGTWPAILSADIQTDSGQKFWIERMLAAHDSGFRLGFVDMPKKTIEWFEDNTDPNLPDIDQWIDYHKQHSWGIGAKFKNYRFIIAK